MLSRMLLSLFERPFPLIGKGGADQQPSKVPVNVTGGLFKCCHSLPQTEDVVCCKHNILYMLVLPGFTGADAVGYCDPQLLC